MMPFAGSRRRQDLSGPWQLAFDPGEEGVRSHWMAGNWPLAKAEPVQVPALWDVTHPDAEGVGFYRRAFAVPADWQGGVLRLHFGGASYRAEVWLNGVFAGSHEGAYTPFDLDVTSLARAGAENELVVRVAALSKTRDVDGMALNQSPASKQSWYYTHGGLWGEVYLEALPRLSCRALSVEPDLHREMARVEIGVANDDVEARCLGLHLAITHPDGTLAAEARSEVALPPGVHPLSFRIPLPRPVLWDCENPYLYHVTATISQGGEQVDRQTVRFGMREFTVRDGEFFLNGQPILLRGVLLQPDYPVTLVAPPTPDMMEREITLVKEAGFNLIRAHIRPVPPGYLDLTDQVGVLVYAESCLAWIRDSARLLEHGRRELQAMIERDRNHPSVVVWGIYNENRAASALTSEALIRHVRALDPTRVVVDNSGGTLAIDQDFGWADRTTVVPSHSSVREEILDLHIYMGPPLPSPVYEWMRTLGISDLPLDMTAFDFGSKAILEELNRELRAYRGKVFVSELGCGGMADLDQVVAGYQGRDHLRDAREMRAFRDNLHQGFQARRLDQVFGSVPNLIQASQQAQAAGLTRELEALMANPRVSGYVVTHLNDVGFEFHAGLLDNWRNPKLAYEAVKRLNRPHCIILKAKDAVVACGQRIEVTLTLVSQAPLQGSERLCLTVRDPQGRERTLGSPSAPRGTGIREMPTILVDTGPACGEWRVLARLVGGEGTLAEASEAILALPSVELSEAAASVRCLGEAPEALAVGGHKEAAGAAQVLLAARPATLTDEDWASLLAAVAEGNVAIVGPLHRMDEHALRALLAGGVGIKLNYGIGNWIGCYHWLRPSALLAGLPGPGLAGEAYVDVLPRYVMAELGGDVLAGSLRSTQTRLEPPAMLWYSDIEAVAHGRGTMIFCQYRLFEQAATSPLAGALLRNLVRLALTYRQHKQR